MNRSSVRRALTSPAAIDLAIAVAVAIVAYRVARLHLLPYYHVAPWIEDLLVPCTQRPGWVPNPAAITALPEWQALLSGQIEYFPCRAIAGMPLTEVGVSWQREEYFHVALATWFRIVGPKIDGFITFQSGLFALTSAIAYLVFRLGMWRAVALACTAALVWSPAQLWATGLPIEYAKAPWILGTVTLCGLVIRRDRLGQSIWPAALAAGLVAGVGIGFKTDALVAVPLAIATTLIFVRSNPGGPSRKLLATLCVVAGVAVGGGLIIYRDFFGPAGSLLPVQILGGQDWKTEALHAVNPLYDYGLMFDDSHITVLLNNYGHRVLGTSATVYFFSREMQDISTRVLIDFWKTFPGDLMLRVIAAAIRVMQLSGLGLSLAIGGLFLALARDLRAGWFIAFVIVYLSTCASLVFQPRHFFHLAFLSWWLAGFFAQTIFEAVRRLFDGTALDGVRAARAKPAMQASVSLAVIGVCALSALAAARLYQQRGMLRLVQRYEQAPLVERRVARNTGDDHGVTIRVDGLSVRDRVQGSYPDQTGDYLVARFSCRDARPISVTTKYVPSGASWNRTFSLPCAASGTTSSLMVPIYQYGATYVFDGLMVSADDADAMKSVSTLGPDPRVRLWLDLLLPADWRSRDWVERLRLPPEMPL